MELVTVSDLPQEIYRLTENGLVGNDRSNVKDCKKTNLGERREKCSLCKSYKNILVSVINLYWNFPPREKCLKQDCFKLAQEVKP